jgi:hypothetical protein
MESTASSTLSVRGPQFEYKRSPARDAERTRRFASLFKIKQQAESAPQVALANTVLSPSRPADAPWFRLVERRITRSALPDVNTKNDGRWLTLDSTKAAMDFFGSTSDLLPGEPYIYGSQKGDLVAEFTAVHGTLTSIVTPGFTLLFAVVDGVPIEKRIPRESSNSVLRSELKQLTELLRTGQHGSLATGS